MTDLFGPEQQPPRKNDRPHSGVHSMPSMEQDSDIDLLPVSRRTVPAALARPLHPLGPRSVFELDACPLKLRKRMEQDARPAVGRRIEHTGNVTRLVTFPLCETAEWKANEAARRARQTPPRPGAKVLASMNAMKGPPRVLTASRLMA